MTNGADDPTVPVSAVPASSVPASSEPDANSASVDATALAATVPTFLRIGVIGPNAHRRPLPSLASLVAFLAGGFLVGGITAIVGSRIKDHGQLIAFIVGGVLLAGGWALGRALQEEIRTAATVIGASGALAFVAAALIQQRWADNRWIPVLLMLALSAVALALWTLPGLHDRTFLFGAGALLLQAAIVTAVGVLVVGHGDSTLAGSSNALVHGGRWVALVAALTGAIMLAIAWNFAHSDRQGLVTPLLLGGVIGGVGGAATAVSNKGDWIGILTVLFSGIVVMFVGTQLNRRGTAWAGLALTGGGLVAALAKIWDTPLAGGIAALVLGVALMAAAFAVRGLRSSAPTPEGFQTALLGEAHS